MTSREPGQFTLQRLIGDGERGGLWRRAAWAQRPVDQPAQGRSGRRQGRQGLLLSLTESEAFPPAVVVTRS